MNELQYGIVTNPPIQSGMDIWHIVVVAICTVACVISAGSVILGAARKPAKILEERVKKATAEVVSETVLPQLEPLCSEIKVLRKARNEGMAYEINTFAEDLRNGEIKTSEQYGYIIRRCDEYIAAGLNGQGRANAQYIEKQYNAFLDSRHGAC